mgnify:CR=1 FL=1
MFSTYSSRVAELLQKIESGEIALPDLQRPFVWEDAKVRNLLDSMNKGFPVGYVMLWDFPDDYDAKPRSSAIAKSGTRSVRSLLIDGQQRLTALLSAMDGIVVKDKDYRDRRIRISFNPLAKADDGKQIGQFEVWTSATEKDPEWVSDITEVYKLAAENPTTGVFMFCQAYYSAVNAHLPDIVPSVSYSRQSSTTTSISSWACVTITCRSYRLTERPQRKTLQKSLFE